MKRFWVVPLLMAASLLCWFGTRGQNPSRVGIEARQPTHEKRISAYLRRSDAEVFTLRGLVHGPAQAPIAGARVCVACSTCDVYGFAPIRCVNTDKHGRYAIDELRADGYRVSAMADGFVPGTARDGAAIVVGRSARSDDIDIELVAGGARVRGTVQDATGGVVSGARVRAMRLLAPRVTFDLVTGQEGEFTLWMPPGALALTASAEGYAATQATLSAPVDGVVLRLIPGGSLRGVVVSAADGEPVADVEVRAQLLQRNALAAPSAWSDEFGEFVIQGLEPGVYKLLAISADARGELPRPVELALGTTIDGLRVAVGPATEVSGHVRLAGDKQRCRQGFVQLGAPDPTTPMSSSAQLAKSDGTPATTSGPLHFTSQIDVEGRVRFKGVPPGRYFVTVRCEGHLLRSGPDVIEVSTTPYTDLLWEVEPGVGLTVRVVDSRGRPVSGAGFLVQWPTWHGGRRPFVVPGTTGDDGAFVYPNILHEGVYEVSSAPPFDAPKLTVELKSGEGRREVTLRLSGDAWIAVQAQTPTRAGVDSLHVVAIPLSDSGQAASDGAFPATRLGEGRYRIGPLSAGIYLVEAHDGMNPAFRPREAEGRVLVAAGAERTRYASS